jgi:hypothetical protein
MPAERTIPVERSIDYNPRVMSGFSPDRMVRDAASDTEVRARHVWTVPARDTIARRWRRRAGAGA